MIMGRVRESTHEGCGKKRRKRRAFWGPAFLLIFLCLLQILLPAARAEDDERVFSKFLGKNWVNGKSWERLDYSGKLGFVCGLFDGITLFYSVADGSKNIRKSDLSSIYNSLGVPDELTVGDVVKGMDMFYSDPENIKLPAICAYMHFVYKSRYDSPESIEKRVALWRRMF